MPVTVKITWLEEEMRRNNYTIKDVVRGSGLSNFGVRGIVNKGSCSPKSYRKLSNLFNRPILESTVISTETQQLENKKVDRDIALAKAQAILVNEINIIDQDIVNLYARKSRIEDSIKEIAKAI